MLKKWFIILAVLSCTFFAVFSGCSEKIDVNPDQNAVEKSNEKISKNSEDAINTKASKENSDNWCPVGTSLKQTDPTTGEVFTMEVTGIETVDGVSMCKAVGETSIKDKDDSYLKTEYLWSQDGKTSSWTVYDKSGNKISEATAKDDKMKIVDKDGKITEFTMNSE